MRLKRLSVDDTTDEAGFDYIQRVGGAGIKVGPGPSLAQYRIPSAQALRAALARAAGMPDIRKEST